MIVNGKAIATDILARAKARALSLPHPLRVVAIVANETPATRSYLKIKERYAQDAGCAFEVQSFPEDVSTAALCAAVARAGADAIIVQLPLPHSINAREVCDAIPLVKDADVLSGAARIAFEADEPESLVPPVASALAHILASGRVELAGKRAVVIGAGWLVGKPCASWLAQQGADVTQIMGVGGDVSVLADADIIVSGVGAPHLIKPHMIKDGVVLIDAGTSESGGTLRGDADPACAEKCTLFTPVPGGVGPVAVACLFENATLLATRKGFTL